MSLIPASAMMSVLGAVTLVDDGDAAPSSGTGTATHTYNSQTSTGPVSVIAITWDDGGGRTLDSITWNGVAMTIMVQANVSGGSTAIPGAALCIINGAQSGSVVATFDASCDDSEITKISLSNLQSLTPIDTDSESSTSGGSNLDSLASPGTDGIRLTAYAEDNPTASVSWTNATEVSDINGGSWRHSVAYDLGDDATTIEANGGGDDEVHVGVSLR